MLEQECLFSLDRILNCDIWYQMHQPPQGPLQSLISIVSPIIFTILGFCLSFLVLSQWYSGLLVWISIIKQLFAILSMHTISGCLCSITLSNWMGKSHKIIFYILHPALNQEHVHTTCHYIVGEPCCIVANGFPLLLYHAFFGNGSLPD